MAMKRNIDKTELTQRRQQVRKLSVLAITLALICCLISSVVAPQSARAADSVQVPLVVTQILSSDGSATPPQATFTYRLTAQSPSAPLPEGASADGYTFTITGNTDAQIAPISFVRPGAYSYELSCLPTAEAGFTTDTQIYTIEMYVTTDLSVYSIVYLSDENKTADIRFTQRYSALPSNPANMVDPPVQKTVRKTSVAGGILPKTGDMLKLAPYVGLCACAILSVLVFLLIERRARRIARS